MSESDTFSVLCPCCNESHYHKAPQRSVASYIFLNNIQPSYYYRLHMFRCKDCVRSENAHKFTAYQLQDIFKELSLYDKKNGLFLKPGKRIRSDCTSKPSHLAITPTFPNRDPSSVSLIMNKIHDKMLTLDPDSQIESHFEIGGSSGDGVYHYHIYAITKMSLCKRNNKILSNIMNGQRIDIKKLHEVEDIGKWRNYIKKDLDKFEDNRTDYPSFYINIKNQ